MSRILGGQQVIIERTGERATVLMPGEKRSLLEWDSPEPGSCPYLICENKDLFVRLLPKNRRDGELKGANRAG
jgi:hypothetical protein